MALFSPKEKVAVGLFVDGLDLKFVCLESTKSGIRLRDYKTTRLVTKLDESKFMEADITDFSLSPDESSSFDIDADMPSAHSLRENEIPLTNSSVLANLLSQVQDERFAITYAITEPAIDYQILETDFGLQGKKLKERVLEELANIRSIAPDPDTVSILETESGNLICIIREDGIHLANMVNEVKDQIGQRVPKIPVIDSAEVALMNAVRMNYNFNDDEHTLVVYVAQDFTRLVFMRGSNYQHFAPVIAEGIESINIQNTIYSRASLEQDNIGIHHLDRIILTGDAYRMGLREFFKEKFAVSDVSYMKYDSLDTSSFPADSVDELSEYSIPIATAWKALEPAHPRMYPSNLLPSHMRSQQNVFKMAWHGYMLLALLFVTSVFFAAQIPLQHRKIQLLEEDVTFKETQALELEQLEASVNRLHGELSTLESALALYEEITPGADRWSKTLTHMTSGVEDLNSLWILEVNTTGDGGGGLRIQGYSIFRSRIPRFANLFDNAILQEVTVQEIRERIVYRFTVVVDG